MVRVYRILEPQFNDEVNALLGFLIMKAKNLLPHNVGLATGIKLIPLV